MVSWLAIDLPMNGEPVSPPEVSDGLATEPLRPGLSKKQLKKLRRQERHQEQKASWKRRQKDKEKAKK